MLSSKKYFYKNIHISLFNKYFYRNKKSNICFGDCVIIQNDFIYQPGGSTSQCVPKVICTIFQIKRAKWQSKNKS